MKFKKEKGVTLILLVITIIIITIIAGIAIYTGTESIKKAKFESIKTDMMLIKAKAREYVEKASFEFGPNSDEEKKVNIREKIYETEAGFEKGSISQIPEEKQNNAYKVGSEALAKMGLNNIDENEYYVAFDETNVTAEVYSKTGYNGKYSLTELDEINIEEIK